MLNSRKYKQFTKTYSPLECLPKKKILSFHKSKWKAVQKLILKNSWKTLKNKKIIFQNFNKIICTYKRWNKSRFAFRSRLKLKKNVQFFFFGLLSNWQLKTLFLKNKNKDFISIFQQSFFKMEYRIDILVWRLKFFSNLINVNKNISKCNIFLNKKKINSLNFVKLGDLLEISKIISIIKPEKSIYDKIIYFYTFLEIDYYTNTFIIVKSLNNLTKKDFYLLIKSYFDVLSLKDYILK